MKKLIFLLFVALLVTLSQATIIKIEAEDSRKYYIPGEWTTLENEDASGGKYITATNDGTSYNEAYTRYYSLSVPAGTYTLYVRVSMETAGGRFVNDSFYHSDASFAVDANMRTQNNTPSPGLDGVSTEVPSWGWVNIQGGFVSTGGEAIFKLSTREDGCHIDAFVFADEPVTDELLNSIAGDDEPHDPLVTPVWEDGSSGDLDVNNTDVTATLNFKAPGDPNKAHEPAYPVNPDVIGHYIYLSNGDPDDDPNVHLLDYVPLVHNADPYLTDPNVTYGPVGLIEGTVYYWQAESAFDSGGGTPYAAGDPNNILGGLWNFTTIAKEPKILEDPANLLVDFSGNGSFSVTAGPSSIITGYQWFKVGDPDIALTDAGIYSGTTTDTLTITGATETADGEYYCIAYNGAFASEPSANALLWYPRLVSHYPFESLDEETKVSPDVVSGFDATMLSNDGALDVPSLEPNVVPGLTGSTFSLKFDNPDLDPVDPNDGEAQYAEISDPTVGLYQDMTVSAWIYSSGGSNWNRILDFGNNNANYTFLCVNPGSVNRAVRFAVNVNGSEQNVTTPADALPDNAWTYVTATLAGDTARIYIDGELVTTGTITNDPMDYGPTTQNWLGRSQWGAGDGYFNGLIDELKIYNYALSTEQIAQDYLDVRGDWVCNQELNDLEFDYDNDCEIGIGDLAYIVEEWVVTYRIYPE